MDDVDKNKRHGDAGVTGRTQDVTKNDKMQTRKILFNVENGQCCCKEVPDSSNSILPILVLLKLPFLMDKIGEIG